LRVAWRKRELMAKAKESLLITRNTRDHPAGELGIRFPYVL
jgi:hypothetical protein